MIEPVSLFPGLVGTVAYIDPSAGGYLIQMLLAGLLGAIYVLRSYLARAMGWIRRLFTGPQSGEE